MNPHERLRKRGARTRRAFLQDVGAGVPTLTLLATGASPAESTRTEWSTRTGLAKFTPIDLSPYFSASAADFGQRERARGLKGDPGRDGLIRPPAGNQTLRGIPFLLGPEGVQRKAWVALSTGAMGGLRSSVDIPLQLRAAFLCLAAFCDSDENENPKPGEDAMERVGQLLAEAKLLYADGQEYILPIRRRFEVDSYAWGHRCFAAIPHLGEYAVKFTQPLRKGTQWGQLQMGIESDFGYVFPEDPAPATVWICALANPSPERTIKALSLRAACEEPFIVCGLTLFRGHENPLRYERLALYRFTLPEAMAEEKERWKIDVDLGVVARTYVLRKFEPDAWLTATRKGWGESQDTKRDADHLYAEIAASSAATVSLLDSKTGERYEFDLGQVAPGREVQARPAGVRIEILEAHKVWLHGRILDAASQRPTPVRLAFRSKEGRYIPPYGHRTEINDGWFQDYGADVTFLAMDSPFAYVDGTFQVELPVGEVYVEITKGFEYEPVRTSLRIEPQQRELNLEIARPFDYRTRGWVTADVHVHFLSPTTAVLEGEAEGLNLINLLAAQLGDLFSNVGDLPHGPLSSRDGEMLVQLGTENRQHLLGHLGLLGTHGDPVYPMSASGPFESHLGDPLWSSMADWADACRERGGLVVAVHFPFPNGELAADVVLGKIDALEIYGITQKFNDLAHLEWYRYLNCGYRLPAVGGTDKMGAYLPVGLNRTYAYLGQEEFNFTNWANAIRRGNTFMTTGPLLFFLADGHPPGEEITLGAGGGTVEVRAEVTSIFPFHSLEIVMNGRVVASREAEAGTREMKLVENLKVPGPAWLAARCASRLGPTIDWYSTQAHTSPVYIRVAGQELLSLPAAAYMLTLIDGAMAWVDTLATRPDPERFARTRGVFEKARARLHRRLHEHGIPH